MSNDLLCNNELVIHLRDSICQRQFKVHTFEWMSLIKVDEAVQAVKCHLINKVVLCLSILLLGFDPAVLHFSFTPNVFRKSHVKAQPRSYSHVNLFIYNLYHVLLNYLSCHEREFLILINQS